MGLSRSGLLQRAGEGVSERVARRFGELIELRSQRVPLQHLTGVQEFWSLEFQVTPAVLVPRPETELLVEEAIRHAENSSAVIADIGTGSGNIAVALARELPSSRIFATDCSAEALEIASRNAVRHGVSHRIRFLRGHLGQPLEGAVAPGELDLLVSNPPYVSESELVTLEPEVRDHEPRTALVPTGGEALSLYPELLAAGARFLKPGGKILLELPAGGAQRLPALMAGKDDWRLLGVRSDYSGIPRVMIAQRRGA